MNMAKDDSGTHDATSNRPIYVKMALNGKKDNKFQVETRAARNVVRELDLPSDADLTPAARVLSFYNRSKTESLGEYKLHLENVKRGAHTKKG